MRKSFQNSEETAGRCAPAKQGSKRRKRKNTGSRKYNPAQVKDEGSSPGSRSRLKNSGAEAKERPLEVLSARWAACPRVEKRVEVPEKRALLLPAPSASARNQRSRTSAVSMLSSLLNETGSNSISLGTSSWPWWGKWGSWQSSFSGSPMRSLGPKPGPPGNEQPFKRSSVMSSSTW